MKKIKLARIAKALGVPLLLLATPLTNVSSRFRSSRTKLTKTFISSPQLSTSRRSKRAFVDCENIGDTKLQTHSQPFSSFCDPSITQDKNPDPIEPTKILDFLSDNGLLIPGGTKPSIVGGTQYRKLFADSRRADHCHVSYWFGYTTTTFSSISSAECYNYNTTHGTTSWDAGNPYPSISGTVASQPVNHGEEVFPFSAVTISDGSDDVSLKVTMDDSSKGSFSSLSGFDVSGDGVVTYASDTTPDTVANAQAVLRGLGYTPAIDRVGIGLTETTTLTLEVTDTFSPADPTSDNTTTVVSGNSVVSPGAPTLLSPENLSTVSSPVTLSWSASDDDTGSNITYTISLCENSSFSGCTVDSPDYAVLLPKNDGGAGGLQLVKVVYADTPSDSKLVDSDLSKWFFMLIALSGFGYIGLSMKMRRKYLILLMMIMVGVMACKAESEDEDDKSDGMNVTVSNLVPNQTYYWKVKATNESSFYSESSVFSFTVE
ncbi:MAG: fibronectin type III domain-containing protein [Proteobacteria bacterium]|nr:fibronectin type III domain-containing protein [Pseudomonadota bacterium]